MKYQPYGQLAGLPRNICKYSHIKKLLKIQKSIALNTVLKYSLEYFELYGGMLNFYHRCLISEIIINKYMSQTIRDKMYSQQGNSPTQVLRSQIK